jgi:ankyrin repeat protein
MSGSALLRRIETGRTDLICELLAAGDRVATLRDHGADLLRWSLYFGDVTACRILLDAGQSLDVQGSDLGLNAAAFHGHWQLCEFLLESGAPARFVNPSTGETPLHSALTNEDRDRFDLVVEVLLRAGADPNAVTTPGSPTDVFMRDARTRGEAPLHRAALCGTPRTITLLVNAGANREARDAIGETPLAWASWARRPIEVLRALLYGAYRIHPDYKPMRTNLLGRPDDAGTAHYQP